MQLSPQPVIRLVDANGNTVPNNSVTITAALASGSGTLGGTLTAVTTSGVASFSSLALTGTAGAYTLNFSAGGLTPVTSGAITLSAGAPAAVAFLVQPSTVTAGALITPAVQVRVMDGAGNTVTTATNSVDALTRRQSGWQLARRDDSRRPRSAAWRPSPRSRSTGRPPGMLWPRPPPASLERPAPPSPSTRAPRAALVVTTAPTTAQSGVMLAPQPAVRLVDALGNTVATTGTTITASLAAGGATLGGTLTANTASGVATFTNLVLTGTAGSYSLSFASAGLTGVASGPIALTAGTPAALAFAQQPSTVTAGNAIAPAVTVRVVDGAGNTVTTANNTVTVAIGTNPGGSTLGGTVSVAAVSGVATFGAVTLDRSGAGYTLTAAATGLTGATSAGFTVNPGAASALAITTAPTAGQSGSAVTPQPVVRLVDANGNTVPTTGTLVTATLASGTGTLTGATATTVNGVATFLTLAFTGTAGNISLAFNATGVAGATTGLFPVTAGAPASLAFVQQPSTSTAGANITPTIQVRVLDASGNQVSTATNAITLAIGTNPGGGVLSGTTTQAAASGSASFPGLSINRSGTGYTLAASAAGLTGATSVAFDVTPAAASRVAFTVQPSAVTAGASIAPAVQVEVRTPSATGSRVRRRPLRWPSAPTRRPAPWAAPPR